MNAPRQVLNNSVGPSVQMWRGESVTRFHVMAKPIGPRAA